MRHLLPLIGAIFALPHPLSAHEIKWPDARIPVPTLVRAYIVAECFEFKDTTEEKIHACIRGEMFGYRAVVMMLSEPATGEEAAERYRACRAGLGNFGGRFHRRRAECIATSFGYRWHFEYSRRASTEKTDTGKEASAHGIAPQRLMQNRTVALQ